MYQHLEWIQKSFAYLGDLTLLSYLYEDQLKIVNNKEAELKRILFNSWSTSFPWNYIQQDAGALWCRIQIQSMTSHHWKNIFSFDEQKEENESKKLIPTEEEEEDDEYEDEEEEEENMQQNYEEQHNELAGIIRGTTKKILGHLVKTPEDAEKFKKSAGKKKRSKIVMDLLAAIEDYYQPFHAKMTITKEEDIASSQSVNDLKNRITELEKIKKGLQDNLDRD